MQWHKRRNIQKTSRQVFYVLGGKQITIKSATESPRINPWGVSKPCEKITDIIISKIQHPPRWKLSVIDYKNFLFFPQINRKYIPRPQKNRLFSAENSYKRFLVFCLMRTYVRIIMSSPTNKEAAYGLRYYWRED